MTRPRDTTPATPTPHWQRLRRLFQFEGNLGSLRYQARFGIFELKEPTYFVVESDSETATTRARIADSARATLPTAEALGNWESEGGAAGRADR